MTQNSKGFTLVEVIVAALIVAATAAGIFASFIAAGGYVQRSKRRIIASNLYRGELEKLRAKSDQSTWDNPWDNTIDCDPDTNRLIVTTGHTCSSCSPLPLLGPAESGWTCWKRFDGTFGGAPWNGRRHYKVTEVTPSGPRQVEVEMKYAEPGS